MEMKNIHVEQLAPVLKELGDVKHPMLSFNIAMMQQKVIPVLEALQKARVPDPAFQKYNQERLALCELHAKKDEAGNAIKNRVDAPGQGGWQDNYEIENVAEFTSAAGVLGTANEEILREESVRQKAVLELLSSPSELEFTTKIKYSWCKDHLTGNNLALLMACDVLELDETPEGTPVIKGVPAVAAVADDDDDDDDDDDTEE